MESNSSASKPLCPDMLGKTSEGMSTLTFGNAPKKPKLAPKPTPFILERSSSTPEPTGENWDTNFSPGHAPGYIQVSIKGSLNSFFSITDVKPHFSVTSYQYFSSPSPASFPHFSPIFFFWISNPDLIIVQWKKAPAPDSENETEEERRSRVSLCSAFLVDFSKSY